MEHFFPQIYAQMYTHSNYWGDADVEPLLKLLGGYSQIIGIYISLSLLVLAPLAKGDGLN